MNKFFVRLISIVKNEYFLLSLILLLGLGVRLYRIDNPVADWHSWRQADTASVAKIYVNEGIDFLRPRYHDISSIPSGLENPQGFRFVEFPIFNALHALFYQAFPSIGFDKAGRLTSVLASLASTVLVFFLGKRFIGNAGGLLAAFFFAALPFNIYFSRVILPEPLAVTFGLAGLWFFVRYIDARQENLSLFLATVLFAAAILTKPFTIFYGIPMLYLAWVRFGRQIVFQTKLWVFLSAVLSPFFVWRAWVGEGEFLRGIPAFLWAFNGDHIRFRPSFWWWIFGERIGRLMLGGWAVLPFVVGLMAKKDKKFAWFLHVFILSQVVYFIVVATANVRHDYYQTISIPAIALVLGAGTFYFWKIKGLNKYLQRLGLLGAIIAGIAISAFQIKEFYKINHPEIIRAGDAVQSLTPEDAKIIAPYNGDTAFLYQTNRRGWPIATLPIGEMIERRGAEYYVSVNLDSQTKEVMENYKVIEQKDGYVLVDLRSTKNPNDQKPNIKQ